MLKPNRKSSRRDFLKKGSAVVAAMGATPRALNAQTMDEEHSGFRFAASSPLQKTQYP